ncbi:MAG: recombinase family protein [Thermoleophilia bacterium]
MIQAEGGNKAVIYARVSTKEQEREGFSIEAQLDLNNAYAEKHNLIVKKEYVEAETAKKSGRPQFNSMLDYLRDEANKTNPEESCRVIIVEKTDRLHRNLSDYATMDELVRNENIEIHFVKDNEVISRDSSSQANLIYGLKAILAKNYSDNLSEETKKGHVQKAKSGFYPSRAPIGYINVHLNGQKLIEPDSQNAPLIRRAYELYATGNYSLTVLNALLFEEGLATEKAGNRLTRSNIHKILSNPIYYGDFEYDGVHYAGVHEPIISKELWDKVQAIRSDRNRKGKRKQKYDWAFRGLVTCAHCGCAMTAEKKKGKYTYYHCTGHRGKCGEKYVPEAELDKQFGEALKAIEIDEEVLQWVVVALKESHVEEKDHHSKMIAKYQKMYQTLQKRIDLCYIDKLDGKVSEDVFERLNARWCEEQEKARHQIEKHEKANRSYIESGVRILELAKKAASLYKLQDMSKKRQLLEFVFSNSTWMNGKLIPNYRKPFDLLAVSNATHAEKKASSTQEVAISEAWCPEKDSNLRPTA